MSRFSKEGLLEGFVLAGFKSTPESVPGLSVLRLIGAKLAAVVRAVIKTEELLLDMRKSWTFDNSLQTSLEELESVLDTEPMGDRRDEVSSSEVEL
jgi:hypothetical protein